MIPASGDITPEHLLRELAPQVLGAVIRRFREFAGAEDAAQEALIAAAAQWPREGRGLAGTHVVDRCAPRRADRTQR